MDQPAAGDRRLRRVRPLPGTLAMGAPAAGGIRGADADPPLLSPLRLPHDPRAAVDGRPRGLRPRLSHRAPGRGRDRGGGGRPARRDHAAGALGATVEVDVHYRVLDVRDQGALWDFLHLAIWVPPE